jgi:hypothetical protein
MAQRCTGLVTKSPPLREWGVLERPQADLTWLFPEKRYTGVAIVDELSRESTCLQSQRCSARDSTGIVAVRRIVFDAYDTA